MTVTCWGVPSDAIGATWWVDEIRHVGPGGHVVVEQPHHHYAKYPGAEFKRQQPAHVPGDLAHNGRAVGEMVFLERKADYWLYGVAVLDSLTVEDLSSHGRCWFQHHNHHRRAPPRDRTHQHRTRVGGDQGSRRRRPALPTAALVRRRRAPWSQPRCPGTCRFAYSTSATMCTTVHTTPNINRYRVAVDPVFVFKYVFRSRTSVPTSPLVDTRISSAVLGVARPLSAELGSGG
jgi:hypothetical protein